MIARRGRLRKLGKRACGRLRDERGQMMVELCVIFPVVMIIALIAFNALTFFGDCARFDRLMHNSIRIASSSPSTSLGNFSQIGEDVLAEVEAEMQGENIEVNMSVSVTAENYLRSEAELVYHPTLFGLNMRQEIFGVSLPSLTHTVAYTIDPYRAGQFL